MVDSNSIDNLEDKKNFLSKNLSSKIQIFKNPPIPRKNPQKPTKFETHKNPQKSQTHKFFWKFCGLPTLEALGRVKFNIIPDIFSDIHERFGEAMNTSSHLNPFVGNS